MVFAFGALGGGGDLVAKVALVTRRRGETDAVGCTGGANVRLEQIIALNVVTVRVARARKRGVGGGIVTL